MSAYQEIKDELYAIEEMYRAWLQASEPLTMEAKGRVVSWLIDKINSDVRNVAKTVGGNNGTH